MSITSPDTMVFSSVLVNTQVESKAYAIGALTNLPIAPLEYQLLYFSVGGLVAGETIVFSMTHNLATINPNLDSCTSPVAYTVTPIPSP